MEFENTKDLVSLVKVNTMTAREHVAVTEKKIRHVKERVRATSSKFPFAAIPVMVLIRTVHPLKAPFHV